jgi:hypothetical protein
LSLLPNRLEQVLTIRLVLCAWLNGGDQGQQLNLEEGPFIVENGDEQSLEIPFGTSFDAFTDEHNYRVNNHCTVEVTLKVPEGYQVAPDYVTYLGAANILPEGKGMVMASYRLAGASSPPAAEIFDGGFSGGFAVESLHATDPQWSECGGEVELIADANIDVLRSQAVAGIAESEISGEVLSCGYSLRPCDSDLARKKPTKDPQSDPPPPKGGGLHTEASSPSRGRWLLWNPELLGHRALPVPVLSPRRLKAAVPRSFSMDVPMNSCNRNPQA